MSQARETPEVPQHELESAASSDNGVTSSSCAGSEPELESPRICKPPEAVEGTVMVQHKSGARCTWYLRASRNFFSAGER